MYLQNPEKLQILLTGSVTTSQLAFTCSYHVVAAAGMELPQVSTNGVTNNTTAVDLTPAAGSSKTIQVTHFTIYNADTTAKTVIIQKYDASADIMRVALLQSGDTLEWSREKGFVIHSTSTQESAIIVPFIASGTYTKTAKYNRALIFACGGGGGAGSGARNAAGINRFGGGGGAGSTYVFRMVGYDDMPSSAAVTIGAGGTGGAGILVDTTNGSNGVAGGDTTFSGIVTAKGGGAGVGGTTAAGTAGVGGQASGCVPAYGPFAINGAAAGAGTATTGTAGTAGLSGVIGCPSGSGGSGINSSNTVATAGGAGGGVYNVGTLVAGPTAGASPNGTNNVAKALLMSTSFVAIYGIGTGGAGGFGATYKNGGNGGNYGAGGGGGAATLNGTTSGSGGNGGGGLLLVMEIF
jgi:hypothetical protein